MSASAGRILLLPKGAYSSSTQYSMLDVVYYNNTSFICKKTCKGVTPQEGEYWMKALEQLPVVDNLTSDDATKALSAKQGKNLDIEVLNLKMLGWTVPKEMTVQNYIDDNGVFHQKVGRVDLGTLDWILHSTIGNSYYVNAITTLGMKVFQNTEVANWYCNGYNTIKGNTIGATTDKVCSCVNRVSIMIRDTAYSSVSAFKNAMQGKYLYYELATEILIPTDGNEATTNQMLSDEWNSTTTYAQSEFCIYNNTLWKSKVNNNSGNTPAEGSYWTATNVGKELSNKILSKNVDFQLERAEQVVWANIPDEYQVIGVHFMINNLYYTVISDGLSPIIAINENGVRIYTNGITKTYNLTMKFVYTRK